MYRYLINLITLFFCLLGFMGCQSYYSNYGVESISKRTNDFDLCFPVNYQRLFNAPDSVRFNYLKEIKKEISNRKLDCNLRFEAYKIKEGEWSGHRSIEELDLERLNKEILEKKNMCRNELKYCDQKP